MDCIICVVTCTMIISKVFYTTMLFIIVYDKSTHSLCVSADIYIFRLGYDFMVVGWLLYLYTYQQQSLLVFYATLITTTIKEIAIYLMCVRASSSSSGAILTVQSHGKAAAA
jgi:hypothetical protein